MQSFRFDGKKWEPTDSKIIPLLIEYWRFQKKPGGFRHAFREAVRCGRIIEVENDGQNTSSATG